MRRRALIVLAFVGAIGPTAAATDDELRFIGARTKYWAFQKVVRPAPPDVQGPGTEWIKSPIDAFILQKLAEKQLAPSPPLDRTPLLRRLTFDLTGLPPTPEEVAAFLQDKSPEAYAKNVDRLLASPHYGEHWATKWLDIVRY